MSSHSGEPRNPDLIKDSELEPEISLEKNFSRFVILDCIPIAPASKIEKLENVLRKILSGLGTVEKLFFPTDQAGGTKGYCFVTFKTAEEAQNAVEKIDKYSLDKNHTIRATSFEEFDEFNKVPETFTPPPTKTFEQKENLRAWLSDDRGIDQYALLYGDRPTVVEVVWNELKLNEAPSTDVKRENWTDSFIKWSPLGTYLTTIHHKGSTQGGVQIWGGSSWSRIMRFSHPEVKSIQFSPCEKYLITSSVGDNSSIIVWDVRTGKLLRQFDDLESTTVFKWSHDDKYVTRMTPGLNLMIYELPSMKLFEKKPLSLPGIKDFSWSPSENLLAYVVVPSSNDVPSSVRVLEIPSKKDKVTKNFFKVKDSKLFWQSNGDFLALQIEKEGKKKVPIFGYQVFRFREKNIPSELFELAEGEVVTDFAWEPKGSKIGIIHGVEGSHPSTSFYSIEGPQTKHLITLDKKPINKLYWSPLGTYLVIVGFHNGTLEFYNVKELQSLAFEDHYRCTSLEWDPTGRYVTSMVSLWKHELVETDFNIYSFSGKLLKKQLKDRLFDFLWRPRPPTLLSPEKLKEIEKNVNKYGQKFKKADEAKVEEERKQRDKKRQDLRNDFNKLQALLNADYNKQREDRHRIPGYLSDEDAEFIEREEISEYLISQEETIIG